MRYFAPVLLLLLSSCIAGPVVVSNSSFTFPSRQEPPASNAQVPSVIEVLDGRTLLVDGHYNADGHWRAVPTKVELLCIRPATGKQDAKQREWLERYVEGQPIQLVVDPGIPDDPAAGTVGRYVYITDPDRQRPLFERVMQPRRQTRQPYGNINVEMVRRGIGRHDPALTKQSRFVDDFRDAAKLPSID